MLDPIEYETHAEPVSAVLIHEIAPVYQACFGQPPPPDFVSSVMERQGTALHIARTSKKLVAYKLGYRRNREVFYSWLGGVLPEHRQRGIARQLMRHQHAWCEDRGYRRVRTDTTNAFRSMLLLNIRAGFDVIGTYHDAERGLTIMLEKAL